MVDNGASRSDPRLAVGSKGGITMPRTAIIVAIALFGAQIIVADNYAHLAVSSGAGGSSPPAETAPMTAPAKENSDLRRELIDALTAQGFEVIIVENLARSDVRQAWSEYKETISRSNVVLGYFSIPHPSGGADYDQTSPGVAPSAAGTRAAGYAIFGKRALPSDTLHKDMRVTTLVYSTSHGQSRPEQSILQDSLFPVLRQDEPSLTLVQVFERLTRDVTRPDEAILQPWWTLTTLQPAAYYDPFEVAPAYGAAWASMPVDLRSGPGTEYPGLRMVKPGDQLTVTGTARDQWTQITDKDGTVGYLPGGAVTDSDPVHAMEGVLFIRTTTTAHLGPSVHHTPYESSLEPGHEVRLTGRFRDTPWTRIQKSGTTLWVTAEALTSDIESMEVAILLGEAGTYYAKTVLSAKSDCTTGWKHSASLQEGIEVEVNGRADLVGVDWLRFTIPGTVDAVYAREECMVSVNADNSAFLRASAADTEQSYAEYLSEYPLGRHRKEAQEYRADARVFENASKSGTRESYLSYLREYPQGRHAQDAWSSVFPRGAAVSGGCTEAPTLVAIHPSGDCPKQPDLTRPFAVGQYEVTFSEWDACVSNHGCNGYIPHDLGWGRGDLPVINVNFRDAEEYVKWLSRATGRDYRLLTGAEWECAARAGTDGAYHFGKSVAAHQANYGGSRTKPVGSFSPNEYGVYDVHGNVQEWTSDCWAADSSGRLSETRSMAIRSCEGRVMRGGSWRDPADGLKVSAVQASVAGYRSLSVGFRVAWTLDAVEAIAECRLSDGGTFPDVTPLGRK